MWVITMETCIRLSMKRDQPAACTPSLARCRLLMAGQILTGNDWPIDLPSILYSWALSCEVRFVHGIRSLFGTGCVGCSLCDLSPYAVLFKVVCCHKAIWACLKQHP